MKKLSLVLVAAIMLVFASCDSGSNQYKEIKSTLSEFEKAIGKAKDCDELETVYDEFEEKFEDIADKYEDEDLSKEEEKKIDELAKQVEKKYDQREEELCKD